MSFVFLEEVALDLFTHRFRYEEAEERERETGRTPLHARSRRGARPSESRPRSASLRFSARIPRGFTLK
jgi:hypothetical protein